MAKLIEEHWDKFAELSLQEEGVTVLAKGWGSDPERGLGPPSQPG